MAYRQRADGSLTTTSSEWDGRWYWPVGTRVSVQGVLGTVSKVNGVTVRVSFDGEDRRTGRVSMSALIRVEEAR